MWDDNELEGRASCKCDDNQHYMPTGLSLLLTITTKVQQNSTTMTSAKIM
jgi:hypothetical protein